MRVKYAHQLCLHTTPRRIYWSALLLVLIACQASLVRPVLASQENQGAWSMAQPAADALAEIKVYIEAQTFASESERIDFIRNWVYKNSIHLIDEDHNRYAFRTPKVLGMLWQTHLAAEPPAHLSCGPRALAMRAILNELGVPNRVVMIFTDNYDHVRSHTYLEVFNHETSRWEMQDPDFNLTYVDQKNQRRVDTTHLLWGSVDTVVPQSPAATGWEENQVNHLKEEYFEAMMYTNHLDGKKSVILINGDRFQPEKQFVENDNLDFYRFADKHYREPILHVRHPSEEKGEGS